LLFGWFNPNRFYILIHGECCGLASVLPNYQNWGIIKEMFYYITQQQHDYVNNNLVIYFTIPYTSSLDQAIDFVFHLPLTICHCPGWREGSCSPSCWYKENHEKSLTEFIKIP
jgi:hypothetical protein